MRNYHKLKDPKTIVTAGASSIFAPATETTRKHIIDQADRPVPFCIPTTALLGEDAPFYPLP